MHILLIHQAFVTTGDAGGTRHIEIARYLAEKGHQVTIITSPVSYLTGENRMPGFYLHRDEQIQANIRVMYAFTSSGMHKGFLRRLLAFFSFMLSSLLCALSVKNVDVVWGTSPNLFQAFTAWLSARLKGCAFLLEIRDMWPEFAIAVGALKNPLLIRLSYGLEHFLYRHADKMMVNSPGFIPYIEQAGGKTPVLAPNGCDPQMFVSDDGGIHFRQEYQLENAFVVMYCGAHGPANDLELVLDAAERLRSVANIRFVFVGSGKNKAKLIESAQIRHLDNVLFTPPVSKTSMANVLAACDAGLAILKPLDMFKTTYPNKVFDVMASGKPVLCQIDGVIREVVENADAGLFVTPGSADALCQAVQTLASDPMRCRQMGENGHREIMEHFSREKTSAIVEKLLQSHISAKKHTTGKN